MCIEYGWSCFIPDVAWALLFVGAGLVGITAIATAFVLVRRR